MNEVYFSRTELFSRTARNAKISSILVAVISSEWVGSYSAEALACSGNRKFILIDYDVIEPTNINSEILAL